MLRFSLTTLSALLFTATFVLPSVAHAQSKTSDAPTGITERVFGGGGGYPFDRTFVKKIEAAKRVTTLMAAAKLSSTVEAEYFAKVSATFELETKATKMASVSTALDKTIKQGQESELTIPLGHVAVLVNVGQVLQHGDKSWIVPGASSTWLIIDRSKVEDCQRLVGAYDLHGAVLMKQVPGLETETHLDYQRIVLSKPAGSKEVATK